MVPENKVYTVLVEFVHEGLTYAAGQQYELSDEVVASLAEGTVEAFVGSELPAETPVTTETPSGVAVAPAAEVAVEPVPATPWVGGHRV